MLLIKGYSCVLANTGKRSYIRYNSDLQWSFLHCNVEWKIQINSAHNFSFFVFFPFRHTHFFFYVIHQKISYTVPLFFALKSLKLIYKKNYVHPGLFLLREACEYSTVYCIHKPINVINDIYKLQTQKWVVPGGMPLSSMCQLALSMQAFKTL